MTSIQMMSHDITLMSHWTLRCTMTTKQVDAAIVVFFSLTIIFSLREEPVKLSTEVPRQRFWLTFPFLLETVSGLIIEIPLSRDSLLWEIIFNNNH